MAAWLQSQTTRGERVLLLYPPGLEYITAFFGCLYAGVVAVPAYPPRNNRNLLRLQSLIRNSWFTGARKIAARAAHGHDPEQGQVTLMLHKFIGNDEQKVLDLTRGPLSEYLKAHIGLVETMTQSLDIKVDINDVNKDQYLDYLIAFAFERYYQSASLIGTPENACRWSSDSWVLV